MPNEPDLPQYLPFFIAVVFGGLGALLIMIRQARLDKWKRILELPLSESLNQKGKRKRLPRWAKALPKGVDFESKKELQEVLYQHYRARPKLFGPDALHLAVAAEHSSEKIDSAPLIKGSPLSDEDKIQSLLGAPGEVPTALPTEALAQSVVVNLVNVLKGNKKLSLGLEHALWDSLGAGGSFAGAKIGGAAALTLAPFVIGATTAVAPVGVLLGAWVGALAGKKIGTHFKARHYYSAARKLRKVSRNFQKWFLAHFPDFLEELDREYLASLENLRNLHQTHQTFLGRAFFPDLMTTFYRHSLTRLRRERIEERRRYRNLRVKVRALDPLQFAAILEHIDEKTARRQPGLFEHYEAYRTANQDVRDAMGPTPPPMKKVSAESP